MKYVTAGLCSALLGGVFAVWLTDRSPGSAATAQQPRGPVFPRSAAPGKPAAGTGPLFDADGLTPEEAVNVAVYDKVNRSVVNITTKSTGSFLFLEGVSEGSGSGCILDKTGHVLTNYHVIEDARSAGVTLHNGKTYEASMVGADPINDLAVLKIAAPREYLVPVSMGDSSKLRVGMRVFAIGNPFGLERSMATGVISSLNRSLKVRAGRTIRSIIQIDAAVNPGNSGGPLLDTHGRVIGINTAIATRTGQNAGVGFAIPSNLIRRVVPQLVKHGRVIRPEIGIRRVYETDRGLRIAALSPNGPAAKAGLRGPRITRTRRGLFLVERIDRSAADTITDVDGKPVKTADDFLAHIESKRPGDRVVLTIVRDGRKQKVTVTLGGG
ncbi:MAG: S1C family serine protease [Planctomycetaceae bacterium]